MYTSTLDIRKKNKYLNLFILFLVYMSAFRAGLGQDYENYIIKMGYAIEDQILLFDEPFFTIITQIVDKTILSPVFLFLIYAAVTIYCICRFFSDDCGEYSAIAIVIFCLMPTLFFNTFNLVRQFAATGVFFYSLRFIQQQKIIPFSLCILVATCFHLSSLVLFPLYFVLDKKFSKRVLFLVVLSGILIFPVLQQILSYSMIFDDRFSLYFDSSESMGSSTMIILYNVIGILIIIKQKEFTSVQDRIAFNLFFLLILFSDASLITFYYYRFSIYFLPVFCYIFPKVITLYTSRRISNAASIAMSILLFFSLISSGVNNKKIVPEKIYSISTIVDTNFQEPKY